MQLHSPAKTVVLLSTDANHSGTECIHILRGKLVACHTTHKDILVVADSIRNRVESVVGKAASVRIEVSDTLLDDK